MKTDDKHKSIFSKLIVVLFTLLMLGSVFMVSARNYDLFDTYRKYWTIISGLLFVIFISIGIAIEKERFKLPVDSMLKVIVVIGILESLYALAQFFRILPSYNRFFAYTGSFENPAIFAMLLSFCVPIAVYYAINEHTSKQKKVTWGFIAVGMLVFIGFSESRTGLIAATITTGMIYLAQDESLRKKLFEKRTMMIFIPIVIAAMVALYYFKADSANGRLLIWRVSIDMIKDRPLFGFGYNGFTAHYMEYQAGFLESHPENPFMLLADNVNNPFNEYLLILVNFGVVGLVALLYVLFMLVRTIWRSNNEYRVLILSLLLTILVWACFSYPFSIQSIWVVAALIVMTAILPLLCKYRVVLMSFASICIAGFVVAANCYKIEYRWKVISERSLMGETEAVLPDYSKLYEQLNHNGKFLYNYAAELHYSGHHAESLQIFDECSQFLNDYDVQMLMADCYQNISDTLSAISHYKTANSMVPSKFLPLYNIMNLYLAAQDSVNAINIAKDILSREVKENRSKMVQRIIKEAGEIVAQ